MRGANRQAGRNTEIRPAAKGFAEDADWESDSGSEGCSGDSWSFPSPAARRLAATSPRKTGRGGEGGDREGSQRREAMRLWKRGERANTTSPRLTGRGRGESASRG